MERHKSEIIIHKQKSNIEESSFRISIPSSWVKEFYEEELEEYKRLQKTHPQRDPSLKKFKQESLYAYINRQENILLVSSYKEKASMPSSTPSVVSDQEMQELNDSLRLTKDLERRATSLRNWVIAKFVEGYDNVPLSKLREDRAFLKKVTNPLEGTCFVIPWGTYITDGLDFKKALGSDKSILDIYGIIMEKLGEMDSTVRGCLIQYCKTHNKKTLLHDFKNLSFNYDKQIEILMWAVIRKICRYLDFREAKEELSHIIFYIVLAADAKLLERYKDNYLDIIKALHVSSLPEVYCRDIATLMEKSFNLLQRGVEILLASAYLTEPYFTELNLKGPEISQVIREAITEETHRIMEECNALDLNINELEGKVLTELTLLSTYTAEKGRQIWGYSRVFDRLHRHNKRVMNIVQSALFGLPTVESQ